MKCIEEKLNVVAKSFIDKIKSSGKKNDIFFDSHDFIREFIKSDAVSYGELLIKRGTAKLAHADIANFLKYHKNELGLEQRGKCFSENILKTMCECEKWEILK